MQIRPLLQTDLVDLLNIYAHLHPGDVKTNPDSQSAVALWSQILANPSLHYFGAEVEGRFVSTCNLTIVPNLTRGLRPFGLIENVVTAPEFRRKGIASAVIKRALLEAWQRDCYKVMLESGRKDDETLRFYEGVGFKRGVKTAFTAYPNEE